MIFTDRFVFVTKLATKQRTISKLLKVLLYPENKIACAGKLSFWKHLLVRLFE